MDISNICFFEGRITVTPELKTGGSKQTPYTKFSIAVKRKGDKEKTDFINCGALNKTAEIICKYVKKGDLFRVAGSLRVDTREYKGQKQTYVELLVDDVKLPIKPKEVTEPANTNDLFGFNDETDDDELPF